MKLVSNLKRARQSGMALAAAIILFVLFIIFIGTIAYVLWKAIHRLPTRNPDPDPAGLSTPAYQPSVDKLTADVQAEFGTTNVTALYLTGIEQTNLTVFLPFGTNAYDAQIERSTNLVNWETLGASLMGEAYIDTNPPPAQAFYRRLYLNVVGPLVEDDPTNHVPGFMYLPTP